jgi:hypothetical protein
MPLTREDLRAAVERAGDEHWRSWWRTTKLPTRQPADAG